MIFREKDLTNIPAPLQSNNSIDEINESVRSTSDCYSDNYYGHEEVRDALNTIYHGKCCYCERKPESILQIEHYRPKGRITSVSPTGYYWMGNEWSNLMLACDTCNNKKRSKFPLVDENNVRTHPVGVNGDFDISQVSSDSFHLSQEDPLIISPEIVDPSDYLTINELGHYEAIDAGDHGKLTIRYLGLNRDSYVFRRQSIIDSIIDDINDQTYERYHPIDPLTPEQYRRQLNIIFKKLIERTHDDIEYNMLGNCMIEKFEEIILEDIEEEFRSDILDSFIDFLERL